MSGGLCELRACFSSPFAEENAKAQDWVGVESLTPAGGQWTGMPGSETESEQGQSGEAQIPLGQPQWCCV